MKRFIFTLLFCLSGYVKANSACDKPQNDFDGLYCLNKVYQAADKDLNDAYKKLQKQLDSDGKATLKAGQLAWISERNTNCSKYEAGEFYVNLSCATNTTIERLRFLQDRSRECSSSGCQNSKL
jgi:uncharacterized protein YecT (DUF1311 family)